MVGYKASYLGLQSKVKNQRMKRGLGHELTLCLNHGKALFQSGYIKLTVVFICICNTLKQLKQAGHILCPEITNS